MSVYVGVGIGHVSCCRCGAMNYFPEKQLASWRNRKMGMVFHCWSCATHQGWTGETRDEKRQRELRDQVRRLQDRTEDLREQRDAERRSLAATKGHLTRQRKRAAAGTCPCCNRTFKQLADHMAKKHPDYVEAVQ